MEHYKAKRNKAENPNLEPSTSRGYKGPAKARGRGNGSARGRGRGNTQPSHSSQDKLQSSNKVIILRTKVTKVPKEVAPNGEARLNQGDTPIEKENSTKLSIQLFLLHFFAFHIEINQTVF